MTDTIQTEALVSRKVGKPRKTPGSGRKKGTPNKISADIRTFCQDLFKSPKYQARIRRGMEQGTLDPTVEKTLLAYGFGKPTEKIEFGGPDGGPIQANVVFLIPDNGRDPLPANARTAKETA